MAKFFEFLFVMVCSLELSSCTFLPPFFRPILPPLSSIVGPQNVQAMLPLPPPYLLNNPMLIPALNPYAGNGGPTRVSNALNNYFHQSVMPQLEQIEETVDTARQQYAERLQRIQEETRKNLNDVQMRFWRPFFDGQQPGQPIRVGPFGILFYDETQAETPTIETVKKVTTADRIRQQVVPYTNDEAQKPEDDNNSQVNNEDFIAVPLSDDTVVVVPTSEIDGENVSNVENSKEVVNTQQETIPSIDGEVNPRRAENEKTNEPSATVNKSEKLTSAQETSGKTPVVQPEKVSTVQETSDKKADVVNEVKPANFSMDEEVIAHSRPENVLENDHVSAIDEDGYIRTVDANDSADLHEDMPINHKSYSLAA